MTNTNSLTWTKHTFTCLSCHKVARGAAESIAQYREAADCDGLTDAQVVEMFEYCLHCLNGPEGAEGEHDVPTDVNHDGHWQIQRLTAREVFAIAVALRQAVDGNGDEIAPGIEDALAKVSPVVDAARGAGFTYEPETSVQSQCYIDGMVMPWDEDDDAET